MNEQIRNFKESIIETINNSQLPAEVVRLVISEINAIVSAESDRIILQEKINAMQKAEEEKAEEEKENE